MLFRKKSKKEEITCISCDAKISKKYSFCPYCGDNLIDWEREMKEFGMLGRNDSANQQLSGDSNFNSAGFNFTDKIFGSIVNSLMKNLDKQFREMGKSDVNRFPSAIKIKIGMQQPRKKTEAQKQAPTAVITEEQMDRLSKMPRASAKTNVRRLNNKVIYELNAPGIQSTKDVFVSKLESGYEIKAIGEKKVYVNTLPLNLPIKSFSIGENKLFVEFNAED